MNDFNNNNFNNDNFNNGNHNDNYNNESNQDGLGKNTKSKKYLKVLGFFFMITGGILFAITLIDFFSAFGNFGKSPKLFFLGFIGLPLLGFGGMMLSYAYMGKIARFTHREITPVVKDSANYLFNGTKETLKNVYSTVKGEIFKCRYCNTSNEKDARFCKGCGQSLKKLCPNCNNENDSDSRFCNNCGKSIF